MRLAIRPLLVTGMMLTMNELAAVDTDSPENSQKLIEIDCRMEGEGEGLQGAELEAYVQQCVKDLATVRIRSGGN